MTANRFHETSWVENDYSVSSNAMHVRPEKPADVVSYPTLTWTDLLGPPTAGEQP